MFLKENRNVVRQILDASDIQFDVFLNLYYSLAIN